MVHNQTLGGTLLHPKIFGKTPSHTRDSYHSVSRSPERLQEVRYNLDG